jgi:acylphosphatase
MVRARVHIKGFVQGVGFRYFVRQQATALGVSGIARNLPDGSVEVILEGNEEAVKMVIDACKVGPPSSVVRRVVSEELSSSGEIHGFRIE